MSHGETGQADGSLAVANGFEALAEAERPPARSAEYFDLTNFNAFKSDGQYYIIRNRKPEAGPDGRPARTIVVLGTGRSGTTMAAGVLRLLGEELGDNLNPRLEDRDIMQSLLRVYSSFLFWRVLLLRRDFAKIMRDRTRRWKRWVFKSPHLAPFILLLAGTIENPYFVVPTRNLLETSFGLTEEIAGGWRLSFISAAFQNLFLTLFCAVTRHPVMLFSFDHVARKDADNFIDVLADFLSINVRGAQKRAAIDYIDPVKGYARTPGVMGHIDRLTKNRIKGWVSDTRRPRRSLMVDIRVDDRIIATVKATEARLDVRDAGLHKTGLCGFDVIFDKPLRDEELTAIRLFARETNERVIIPP